MNTNPSGAIHPTVFLASWAAASLGLRAWLPLPFPLETLADVLARPLVAVGVALLIWSQLVMWRAGASVDHGRPTTTLVTWGPFRLSRNPIYLALTLLMLGFGLDFRCVWCLVLCVPTVLAVRVWTILPEEAYLEREFGGEYRAYRESVRRWV